MNPSMFGTCDELKICQAIIAPVLIAMMQETTTRHGTMSTFPNNVGTALPHR